MAKSTVPSVAYVHLDDVDHQGRVDAKPIDEAMERCVTLAATALKENPLPGYSKFQSRHVGTLLVSMRWTHRAIRRALGWEGENRAMAIDGLSLARGPLEGLFSICLMLESPRWVDCYMQDGWKKQYERFLLQKEETKRLARFDDYSNRSGPRNLEILRRLLGIAEEQVATLYADVMGEPMPKGVKRAHTPPFPTPGRVLGFLPDGDKKRLLRRLHYEYTWLCSFVHGQSEAMVFKVLADPESGLPFPSQLDVNDGFHRQVREPAYILSLLSNVQAATEISAHYPHDVTLAAELIKAWKEISTDVLLGRAIWALRTKVLLRVLG